MPPNNVPGTKMRKSGMENKKAKQKDTDQKGEQRVKDADKDREKGKTGQIGATTQSHKPGAKEGGETGENAGT